MIDWNTTDDDKPLPPDTDTSTSRRRWGLWFVLLLLIVGVSVGGVYLYQRVQRGNDAMRQDLLVFIRREEQARRLGQADQFQTFLASDTPTDFVEAYRKLFQPSAVPVGVEVTLEEFTLEGDTAEVVVGLGAQRQRRAYRLTAEAWRRVPLVAEWGEEQTAVIGTNGILLTFNASDADFAHQVQADMPQLLDEFQGADGGIDPQATVRIEPHELESAYLATSRRGDATIAVTLNSPQTVEVPSHWTLSGESAIRYTFIQRLWSQWTLVAQQTIGLPRKERLLAASFQVRALRWATAHEPEVYDTLVEAWRTTATANGWRSPLDLGTNYDPIIDPFAPTSDEAGMLLVANTVYEAQPDMAWLAFQNQILESQANNWDALFTQIVNASTRDIEAQARGDAATTEVPALPITGQVTAMGLSDMKGMVHVTVEGYDQPIAVEGVQDTALMFLPPDGGDAIPMESLCVTQFPQVTFQGEWREEGLRLAVRDMSIDAASVDPPRLSTAVPSDTVAYLMQPGDVTNIGAITRFAALSPLGEVTPVLTNTSGFTPYASANKSGFFAVLGQFEANCGIFQVAWYTFDGSEGAQWYLPSSVITTNGYPVLTWNDTAQQGLMLLSNTDSPIPYWRLTPHDNKILRDPDGVLPQGQVATVSPTMEEVLLQTDDASVLQRVALATDEVIGTYTLGENYKVQMATYGNDGHTLLVGWRTILGQTEYKLILYDLERVTETPIDMSAYTSVFVAQPDVHASTFYLLMGQTDSSTSLVRLAADQTLTSLDTIPPAEHLWQLFACRDGGVAYWVAQPTGNTNDLFAAPQTLQLLTEAGDPRYPAITLPLRAWPLLCE